MDGKEKQLKTRFAPTPSGFLHKGNLFSFILTWLIARKCEGSILLRIDDIDHQRIRDHYLADIFSNLEWLGLEYDEGPAGIEDFKKNFSQKTRMDLYHEAIKDIEDQRGITFNCECSRSQIAMISPNGNYPGTCVTKNLGATQNALRIITSEQADIKFEDSIQGQVNINISDRMNHFVLRKKDGSPSYQLTSVIDDNYFNVNTIVRGNDLLYSSGAQIYLAKHLRKSTIPTTNFYHHPLISNGQSKLSKSQGDSYSDAASRSPKRREKLFRDFGEWIGLTTEIATLQDLLGQFNMAHLKQLRQTTH